MPTRNLPDILVNIEHWTRFTRGFGPASGKDPKLKGATTRYRMLLHGKRGDPYGDRMAKAPQRLILRRTI